MLASIQGKPKIAFVFQTKNFIAHFMQIAGLAFLSRLEKMSLDFCRTLYKKERI